MLLREASAGSVTRTAIPRETIDHVCESRSIPLQNITSAYLLNRQLIVRDTSKDASRFVAELIISRLKAFKPTPSRPHFILGLPTGSSPELIYAFLVAAYKAGDISFRNVVTFNMDEYVGLSASHPQSYHTFMHKHFFGHIDIAPRNVHILNGIASDLEAECANGGLTIFSEHSYESLISSYGPIDLFLGGVGPSGHIAFNEPFSSLTSRTRPVVLASSTIAANARFFNNDLTQVPKRALTVGVGTIMDAREIVIVANGRAKVDAVREGVEGPISSKWTITKLQEHPKWWLCVDMEAAAGLKGETVDYSRVVEAEVGKDQGQALSKARL
ncbi:hypothetical protein MMC10_001464 [Thelotrema lepadinum]|nr:hypothetical protein [Thelotrema lepadinum]